MDFSALVMMEKDKNTNAFLREMDSYEVGEGAEYIKKLFYDGEKVSVFFDTKEDVNDWQYTAIYDVFNEKAFTEKGYQIEAYDEEYNPTWIIKFEYMDDYVKMLEKINEICNLVEKEITKAFELIKDKEEEYK